MKYPRTTAQAGRANAVVVSSVPWEAFYRELAPAFKIDAAGALKAVLPITSRRSETLAVDSSTTLNVLGPSEDADGNTLDYQAPPEATGSAGLDTTLPLELADDLPALGVDPGLRYAAANALLQEVKLLNSYVEYASQKSGFIPYLVRTQVSIMPAKSGFPYDAYVDLSIDLEKAVTRSGSTAEDAESEGAAGDSVPAKAIGPEVVPLLVVDNLESAAHAEAVRIRVALEIAATLGKKAGLRNANQIAKVVESLALNHNSLMTISRVSPNTMRVRFGAADSAGRRRGLVQRNHNVTFLLLVPTSALCESRGKCHSGALTLRTRTEYVHNSHGRPLREMSPRDGKVAENRLLRLTAAVVGEDPVRVRRSFRKPLKKMVRAVRDRNEPRFQKGGLELLARMKGTTIAPAKPKAFAQFLDSGMGSSGQNGAEESLAKVWAAASTQPDISPARSVAGFEVPPPRMRIHSDGYCSKKGGGEHKGTRKAKCFVTEAQSLVDSGKSAQLAVGGLAVADPNHVSAVLEILSQGTAIATVRADAIAYDPDRHLTTFRFPSLAKMTGAGLQVDKQGTPTKKVSCLDPSAAAPCDLRVFVYDRSPLWWRAGSDAEPAASDLKWPTELTNVTYLQRPTAPHPAVDKWLKTQIASRVVMADEDGKGAVEIVASTTKKGRSVSLAIEGAMLEPAFAAKLPDKTGFMRLKDGKLTLHGPGRVVVPLAGIVAPIPVVLTVTADKHDKKRVEVPTVVRTRSAPRIRSLVVSPIGSP